MVKFSIITITKNSGHLIRRTARSLFLQTFANYEWLIVDASTTQESCDIVDTITFEYKANLIRGQDSCISEAWNVGIRYSKGAFILLLNAGDEYSCDFLALCDKHASNSYILCGTPSKVADDILCGIFSFRKESFRRGMTVAHNWMVVPRYVYSEVGSYSNLKYAMDYEWLLRVISRYNISFFLELKEGIPHGKYLLGGYSDKYFINSLRSSLKLSLKHKTIKRHEYFSLLLSSIIKHYIYKTLVFIYQFFIRTLNLGSREA